MSGTPPNLPAHMTWEELELLPASVARHIELRDGKPAWTAATPPEHREFANLLWSGLRRCARDDMARHPAHWWRVHTETNIFFGPTGKSDFVTPDFLIHRCLSRPYQDVRADDVLLAGEVLSPSNSQTDIDEKKFRYARAGIPWYWEVTLERETSAIAMVRAFALETTHGPLPEGVHPLYPANYLLTGKWSPKDSPAIRTDHPFPIDIPWSTLEF